MSAKPSRRHQEQQSAWQTLEALRLGVVPNQQAQSFTVNRERELASIQGLLNQRRGCRVIWGDYGTGKTHLLDLAEHLALTCNFVTARLSLDPNEVALHQPAKIYQSIMSRLRCPGSLERGFEPILDQLVSSQGHTHPEGSRMSRFFSPYLVLRASESSHLQDLARDYLRGETIPAKTLQSALVTAGWKGPSPLRLPNFRTFGRMYIHLVTTLASYCKDAGYEGLVLLLDEAERVEALHARHRHYAFETLKHFVSVTMAPQDLRFSPEKLYKGGRPVHRALPLRFEPKPPLSLLLTLTPLRSIRSEYQSITRSKVYDLTLKPLSPKHTPTLLERVITVYRKAYPQTKIPKSAIASILDHEPSSFRSTVRHIVFQLDCLRLQGRSAA